MRVKRRARDSLRGYAQNHYSSLGDVTIGAKVLINMIDDIADIRHSLLQIATDVRRPRPADWAPEEADERIAAQLERLAEEINE